MHIWDKSPLFKLAIVFSFGIIGTQFPVVPWSFWVSLLFLAIYQNSIKWLRCLFLFELFMCLGYGRVEIAENPTAFQLEDYAIESSFFVRLDEYFQESYGTHRAEATVLKGNDDLVSKGVLIKGDSSLLSFVPGDILFVDASLSSFRGPREPGDFSYRAYMNSRGVMGQLYCSSPPIKVDHVPSWAHKCKIWQRYLISCLGTNERSKELLSAMVLGYRKNIDKETITSFRSAGVMHILAVSGLHVGLIMLLMMRVSFFLKPFLITRILRVCFIISGLWFYALITGAGPSVMRAATMCSFLALGKLLKRRNQSLNLLGASALLLLMIDPDQIYGVGFQLSFLAVTGLILFQPSHLIKKGNRIIRYVKDGIRTTVTAQLWTSPVAVYTFGVFPTYFILGNLLLLPAGIALLYCGIIHLCASPVPIAHEITGLVCEWIVAFMLTISSRVEGIPYSTIEFNSFGVQYVILFYALILFLPSLIIRKKNNYLFFIQLIALACILYGHFNHPPKKGETTCMPQYDALQCKSLNKVNVQEFGRLSHWKPGVFRNSDVEMRHFELGGFRVLSLQNWRNPRFENSFRPDILILSGIYPDEERWNSIRKSIIPQEIWIHHKYYPEYAQKWKEVIRKSDPGISARYLRDGYIKLSVRN